MRILLLGFLCVPLVGNAASLRAAANLAGPMVHISDLWDGAGAAGARVLGPGPVPGGNIIVGAAQLGAIARAYGVDWQPGSEEDQAVVTRPGAPLPQSMVGDLLRPALLAQGAGAGGAVFDLSMPFYDAPMLDAGQTPRLRLDELTFDGTTRRFNGMIQVEVGEAAPMRLRVSGTVEPAVMAVVPNRPLAAGSVIAAADLTTQRMRASTIGTPIALDPAQAVGLQLRHQAAAGQMLLLSDLAHPVVIAKHDRVLIGLALPGLDLGALGEALQPGAVGDSITVRNPVSGAVLSGQVTGPGRVRVEAGGSALIVAAR